MDDKTHIVATDDIQFTQSNQTLPAELIDRITLIHHVFRDYIPATLEQTINNFKYDQNPEREVSIWEHMASVILALKYQYNWSDEKVTKAVKVVLGLSMGEIQANELNDQETNNVIEIWNSRSPS